MTHPAFVDHVVLRVAELDRTERFYTAVMGQAPRRAEDSFMYQVGDTRLFFTLSNQPEQKLYEKEKVGLNHVAFGVRTLEELQTIHARLNNVGKSNQMISAHST
jgi:glyoxylase I family protein